MSTPPRKLAPPETLLGQLQRGRGAGYREALRRPAREAEALIFACLTEDPRWDQQVEERASYYASLLIQFESNLAPLETFLRGPREAFESDRQLPLQTLEELGRRGRRDAIRILRSYLEYAEGWAEVTSRLLGTGRPEAWDGIFDLLLSRVSSDDGWEELAWHLDPNDEPGLSWRAACPALDAACRDRFAPAAPLPSRAQREASFRGLSLEELFARVDQRSLWMMRRVVLTVIRPGDRPLLREHLAGEHQVRCALALHGLAALGQVEDWATFQQFVENSGDPPRLIRIHLVRAVELFPVWISLTAARRWFGSFIPIRAHLGRWLLARYSEPEDFERLREAIPPALAEDEMYHVCSALEGLRRLPPAGRVAEVEQAFAAATYSRAREEAVETMLVHAPEHFVEAYATECLWDAEPWIRRLGCRYVDRSLPDVRQRLPELYADPYEDASIRDTLRHLPLG